MKKLDLPVEMETESAAQVDAVTTMESASEAKLMPIPFIALARGTGTAIDLFAITVVALIPISYDIAAHNFFSLIAPSFESLRLLTKSYGASIVCLALISTPIPIIYLRLFFKSAMRTPTVGETIVGITSYSSAPGFQGVKQESAFASMQWLIGAGANIFACCTIYVLWNLMRLLTAVLSPEIRTEELFGSFHDLMVTAFMLVSYTISYLAVLAIGFTPHSRTDLVSFLDKYYQQKVKRLR